MGPYDWDHMAGLGWFATVVIVLLLLALMIGGLVLMARESQQPTEPGGPSTPPLPPSRPTPLTEELSDERPSPGEVAPENGREPAAL